MEKKLAALRCFKSQIRPSAHPRSIDAVTALAKWRGAQIGVEAAEAFVLLRHVE
jgi:LmbE family N-acetylglucosaminyl deacetylase